MKTLLRLRTSLARPLVAVILLPVALALTGCRLFNGSNTNDFSSQAASHIHHVVFLMQENRTFDTYFGMLNPYRAANGWTKGDDGNTYTVDGIDDKLSTISNQNDEGQTFQLFKFKTTCIDNASSAWLESFGDVSLFDQSPNRTINMAGFVHDAEGYAKFCAASGTCAGQFTDTAGQRAMGYYDQDFLNYYYYMASQFAVSDRWFSPVASKSTPNRLATMTGGTTQGLVQDPGSDDHLPRLSIDSIFQELDNAGVSWKIYYTSTQGACLDPDTCPAGPGFPAFPATTFGYLSFSTKYVYENPTGAPCTAPTQLSTAVGDSTGSFCIDPAHVAPLSQFYTDLKNSTLPAFSYIEPGYGINDEHPGSGHSLLIGQSLVSQEINAFMNSTAWKDSVFFLAYDEGGGPYDHVPPVAGHSNDFTDKSMTGIPDIAPIAVNPDSFMPCAPTGSTATTHCDLASGFPGTTPGDVVTVDGFAAQLGFRVPNMVISPFARRHYVSHIPMDHTAIIEFVESVFLGAGTHLTKRDAAQPDLSDFFQFNPVPWATPPTPPAPVSPQSGPCTPASM